MQSIENYDTSHRYIRLLLQGPPKSGKTVLACQFPKPYVIDLDVNLGGPIRFMRENKKALPIGYDVVDKDEAGKEVAMPLRYARLVTLLTAAEANPNVETIILDSGTMLTDIIIAETLRVQGKPAMTKQEWGFFFNASKQFFLRLTSTRKHIVIPVHERVNKDKEGNVVLPYEINWPGQFGSIMAAFVTDVWRCEVSQKPGTTPGSTVYSWVVRTLPNYQFKLGNSLGLPDVFEFSWDKIQAKLTK